MADTVAIPAALRLTTLRDFARVIAGELDFDAVAETLQDFVTQQREPQERRLIENLRECIDWLAKLDRRKLGDANGQRHAVFVIPPLSGFLDHTMKYFRAFVDVCLKNENLLRQFESEHYTASCW
jgi:hypothetical protein